MSLAQHLLVASPHLVDPNFFQTVVLMVQHTDEGALGLILNRPLSKNVSEIWQMVDESQCDRDEPIYRGGPVDGPLLALHGCSEWGEWQVLPGIYLTSKKELLDKLVHSSQPLKLFVGYSGWGPKQLEHELEMGGWLTIPARPDDVFADPETLWKDTTKRIGQRILEPVFSKAGSPGEQYIWN
ncbi:MAG: UPF0301 protein [Pirellulaceae bacterium]|nr:MAG: UPF0301 protein [Pirellulaceae bacterium]